MTTEGTTRAQLRAGLDDALMRSLPTVSLVLFGLFVLLALLTPFNDPGHVAFFAAQLVLTALFFLVLHVAVRRWRPASRYAHPLASLVVAVLLLGSFTQFVVQEDPLETTGFMLVAVGVGLFFTSTPWFVGAILAVAITWGLAVRLAPPTTLTLQWATLLAQGLLLAVMVYVVRLRSLRRIVTLRARDSQRAQELEASADALRASEARFRLLAENAQDVVYRFVVEPTPHVDYISPSALELSGHSQDEFYARPSLMLDIIHPDDRAAIRRDLKRGLSVPQEFRLLRKDGRVIWCEQRRRPFLAEDGTLVAIEGFVRDITQRKHAEFAWRAEHDVVEKASLMLADAEAIAHLGSADWDLGTGMLRASDELKRIFGIEEPGLLRVESFIARIHPDDRERAEATLQGVVMHGRAWQLEHRVVRPSGEVRFVQAQGRVTRDAEGKPVRAFGTVLDITERKVAERRLSAQHAATRILAEGDGGDGTAAAILHAVGEGLGWAFGALWMANDKEDVLHCVATWGSCPSPTGGFDEETRGRTFSRGIGLPGSVWSTGEPAWIEDVTQDENFPRAEAARCEGLRGAFGFPITVESRPVGVMEFFSVRVEAPDPELLRLMSTVGGQFGLFVQRREAEEKIRRLNADLKRSLDELAEKNRDLETFSYTASHDLQAPLRAINMLSSILVEDEAARLDAAGQDTLLRLRREAVRMSQLVEDLLTLSRSASGALRLEPIDLGRLSRDIFDELREREPGRVVEVVIGKKLTTQGDARLMKVALENMIGNAWKYTSKTRSARIEVGRRDSAQRDAPTFFVRDNGAGFDASQGARLFQPFQRLHGKDFPGTGIGLATVQRIVNRHGGRVWAEGAVGQGATFYFTMDGRAGPGTATSSPLGAPRGVGAATSGAP